MRSEELSPISAIGACRERCGVEDAGPNGVVNIVVEIGEPVGQPHDPALERRWDVGPGVVEDAVSYFGGQIQAGSVALQHIHDAQRLAVVPKLEVIGVQGLIECLLAGVTKGCMAQVMAQRHRLHQILVQSKRAGDAT